MGVAGSGKTTVGAKLAHALGVEFIDGDDLHPPANVQRMAAGIPLTDADREPWLLAIATRLREAKRARRGLVVACSALKRRYRDLLRSKGAADTRFVNLAGDKPVLAERLSSRRGHYMPAMLLHSQVAAINEPVAAEPVWVTEI